MLGRVKKFIGLLFIGFIFMFVSVDSVAAAVVSVGQKYYYYSTKDEKYGLYYGTSSGTDATKGTLYKTLDGEEAYCVQADTYSPKSGDEYVEVAWGETAGGILWNSTQSLIAGRVLDIISLRHSSNEAYVYKYAALNSYFLLNKSENFVIYNTQLYNYLLEADSSYDEIAPVTVLPSFGASVSNTVMDVRSSFGQTYYVGKFTLSNLISSYGGSETKYGGDGGVVTYTITLPSGVTLYSDENLTSEVPISYTGISGDKTFYVKYTGSSVGEQLQIRIVGTNNNVYPIARLWRPVSTNSQMLVTLGTYRYDRSRSRIITFEIPDVSKKTIKVVKKDAGTGENLLGSTLKLQLTGGSNSSCTIESGNYACSISINENLVGDTYYSIVESVAPNGYVKGSSIENVKWDINSSNNVCYASNNSGIVETDLNDCDRSYKVDTVCTTDDGVTKEGVCEVIVDPSLPDDTPEEEKNYVTVGTEEKICYYNEGETVVRADESKCNTQFIKVTNSSGNLVVEYYNNKNHIEISKVAINGDKELIGADLKICSTKPNDKGECTVARNTLEGQCLGNGEDHSSLTNEYNCVNNNDGTKTVDMHWISGTTSKTWFGIPKGTYYLVEMVAPNGYLPISTYVEFSVDADGNVTSKNYDSGIKKIIVENQPTSFKVIKQAVKDGKNLEGATLSICTAYMDENGSYRLDVGTDGYCVPAMLVNGESATWVTDGKAKIISGLGIGIYYLVELAAPENYSIADSILFTVNADGTITDKDGNLINNNELIMKDIEIVNEKTGELPILTIVLVGVVAVVVCGLSYYYLVKKNGFEVIKNKFNKNK